MKNLKTILCSKCSTHIRVPQDCSTTDVCQLCYSENLFWENFPHEISWGELKEAHPELWCQLLNIGQALVLAGKLSSKDLPEEK